MYLVHTPCATLHLREKETFRNYFIMLHYYLIHRTALIVGLRSYLRPRPAVNSNMIFASSSCSAEVQLRAGGVPPSEHVTPLSLLFTREVGAQGVTAGSARPSPSSRTADARIRRCKLLAQGTAPARAVPVYHFPVHSPWILRSRVSRPLLTSSQDPRSPRRAIFAGVSPRCASKTAGVRALRALLTRGAYAPLSNAALRLFLLCASPFCVAPSPYNRAVQRSAPRCGSTAAGVSSCCASALQECARFARFSRAVLTHRFQLLHCVCLLCAPPFCVAP